MRSPPASSANSSVSSPSSKRLPSGPLLPHRSTAPESTDPRAPPSPDDTHFRSDLAAAHGRMLVIHDDLQEVAMQDIIIRIETDDFEAWKTQHYLHAHNR